LKEYLVECEMKEAADSIRQLGRSQLHKFVELTLTYCLDKSDHDRDSIAQLFTTMFEQGILEEEHFVKGFKAVADQIDDLELDIPFASKLVAKMFATVAKKGCVPPSFLEGIKEKVKVRTMEYLQTEQKP